MDSKLPARIMTVDEYLAMEEASSEKHEFHGGIIKEKLSTGFQRSQIASNLFIRIGSFLQATPWRVYGSRLRVNAKDKTGFASPDLTILRDAPQFLEGEKAVLINPSVVIEILNDAESNDEYGGSFHLYQKMKSVKECVFICSSETWVIHYKREDANIWTLTDLCKPEDALKLESIGLSMPLAEVYREVMFDEKDWNRGVVRRIR